MSGNCYFGILREWSTITLDPAYCLAVEEGEAWELLQPIFASLGIEVDWFSSLAFAGDDLDRLMAKLEAVQPSFPSISDDDGVWFFQELIRIGREAQQRCVPLEFQGT